MSERGVQDIIWIMLRAQSDRVDRESTPPRFGTKNYRPDFGIPDLSTLIEVKFIGERTRIAVGILFRSDMWYDRGHEVWCWESDWVV